MHTLEAIETAPLRIAPVVEYSLTVSEPDVDEHGAALDVKTAKLPAVKEPHTRTQAARASTFHIRRCISIIIIITITTMFSRRAMVTPDSHYSRALLDKFNPDNNNNNNV